MCSRLYEKFVTELGINPRAPDLCSLTTRLCLLFGKALSQFSAHTSFYPSGNVCTFCNMVKFLNTEVVEEK